MEFKVVDIPVEEATGAAAVVEALIKNVGKAVEVPVAEGKDPNDTRKLLRARLINKRALLTHSFKTKSTPTSLIAWLEPKVQEPVVDPNLGK